MASLLHSKPVAKLKDEIERFMFLSEKHPVVMTKDRTKFKVIMDAFYNYEKMVRYQSTIEAGGHELYYEPIKFQCMHWERTRIRYNAA